MLTLMSVFLGTIMTDLFTYILIFSFLGALRFGQLYYNFILNSCKQILLKQKKILNHSFSLTNTEPMEKKYIRYP